MRTWFITGSSAGLGRTLTEKLLKRGDRVAATLRKTHALDDLKAEYGDRLWIAQLDVTHIPAIHQVMQDAFNALGRIDVIVNNAGYGLFGSVEEASDDQIRKQIETNIMGSIQIIRAALPYLRAQGEGRIIQLSSAGGQATYPNYGYYHMTKWGIEGFAETVAKEISIFNIGLTIVEPGALRNGFVSNMDSTTPMEVYAQTPAGEVRRLIQNNAFPIPGDPEKTAQAIIDSVDVTPAPLRLALGPDAYTAIRSSLVSRLDSLDAQKDIAMSTKVDE
ncbi:SDR family oxidoreductase [Cytophagaceae bacterium YF14B1]|uniref:SDR family oxidoreductase n=1 Tax=Xanthocytophaga flava TaxID=3048013 RepID=A0AAE3UB64_9BACT|nr:SDR family oxidoreductase [Xanthocytophaga flavus]MDJ1485462.1 SDR family oxidoreductase [Xanthocytophaga flavus]